MSTIRQLKEGKDSIIASPERSAQPPRPTPGIVRVLVGIVLLIHAGLLVDCSRKNFVTFDEAGHLVAGISHWTTGTYSMYRVNPPLARMLAVIPIFLFHPNTQGIQPVYSPVVRSEWRCANQFALDNAARYLDIFFVARLANIWWSCLGGWLVYRWASDLYSYRAGLLGLALWCFDPNLLAHAQLVTPDVPATVAGLAAIYCFWRYLRRPSWSSALLTGIVLGIAQLTKFTLLYLYALWPLLWILHRWKPSTEGNFSLSIRSQARQCFSMAAVSLVVINLGYECQDTGKPLGKFMFAIRILSGKAPSEVTYAVPPINRFKDSWLGAMPVPLPAEYLAGIDWQKFELERGWHSYLRGQWRYGGWWYYYIYGLAVKAPLGALALIVWGLIATLIGYPYRGQLVDEAFVWLPVPIVLILVSSQTGFNHHLRYVLPLFPFAILGASRLAYYLSLQHWKTGLLILILVMGSIGSTLAIHPHYLSYFNEAAGGPQNGPNHLLNSNIDWGQDLLFLKAWLDRHPEAHPLGLAYFNVIDPRVVGIHFNLPPPGPIDANNALEPSTNEGVPRPGYYALSVNFVYGQPSIATDSQGEFQPIRSHQYEYFQHFQPIAKAGYSIFIYHIVLEDTNRVRRKLGLPPLTDEASAAENES